MGRGAHALAHERDPAEYADCQQLGLHRFLFHFAQIQTVSGHQHAIFYHPNAADVLAYCLRGSAVPSGGVICETGPNLLIFAG